MDDRIINSFGAGEEVTEERKLVGLQGLYVYKLLEQHIQHTAISEVYHAQKTIAAKEEELAVEPSAEEQARLDAYQNDPYVATMTEMALAELFSPADKYDFPTRLRRYEMALLRHTFAAAYPNTKFAESNVLISGGGLCVPEVWAQFAYRLKPESRNLFLAYIEQLPANYAFDPAMLFDIKAPKVITATDPMLFEYKSTGDMLKVLRAFYQGTVSVHPGNLSETSEPGIYLSQDTHATNTMRLASKKRQPVVDALTIFRIEPGTISSIGTKLGAVKAYEFVTDLIGMGRNLKPDNSVMTITFGYGNTPGDFLHRLALADFTETLLKETGIETVSVDLIGELIHCIQNNVYSKNMFINLMMQDAALRKTMFAWLSLYSLRFKALSDKDTQKMELIFDRKGQKLFTESALRVQRKIDKLEQL